MPSGHYERTERTPRDVARPEDTWLRETERRELERATTKFLTLLLNERRRAKQKGKSHARSGA